MGKPSIICIVYGTTDHNKAFLACNNYIVIAAGAMHDLNAAVLVPACHDADMFIVGVKGEVPNLCVLPTDRRTAAMLHNRTPAVADDIAAVCRVVKGPVYHAGTV